MVVDGTSRANHTHGTLRAKVHTMNPNHTLLEDVKRRLDDSGVQYVVARSGPQGEISTRNGETTCEYYKRHGLGLATQPPPPGIGGTHITANVEEAVAWMSGRDQAMMVEKLQNIVEQVEAANNAQGTMC